MWWLHGIKSHARAFGTAAAVTAVIAVCGTVVARSLSQSPFIMHNASGRFVRAPVPKVHSIPHSAQSHYVGGPYLTAKTAIAAALQVAVRESAGSPEPTSVVETRLESLAEANQQTGGQSASFYTGTDRMVWLVWLQGPFQRRCLVGNPPILPHQVWFVEVDAKTGHVLGVGFDDHAPGLPHTKTPSKYPPEACPSSP